MMRAELPLANGQHQERGGRRTTTKLLHATTTTRLSAAETSVFLEL